MPEPDTLHEYLLRLRRTPGEVRGRRRILRSILLAQAPSLDPLVIDRWQAHDLRWAFAALDLVFYDAWMSAALNADGRARTAFRIDERDIPGGGTTEHWLAVPEEEHLFEVTVSRPWLQRVFRGAPSAGPRRFAACRCRDPLDGLLRILERESAAMAAYLNARTWCEPHLGSAEVAERVFVSTLNGS